ncbi:Tiny macrocysts protein B [Hondaea fermentalgiana]|uniref:Tiny macrocysts protein B n=1 Tax=Hondaea fermentalgiana TaxID=2315210 RepID=A0A2R5GJ77_9STRA|nr:Tiny macrocysts protein B [Hondaea fermentalgiana]|eukprot:GBG30942.1 Tiny macrocysts protein B [Hondaea fermentalgiana]
MIDKSHPRKYLNEALGLEQAKTDFGGEISNVRKYGSLVGKFRFGLLGVLSLLQKGQNKTSIWITGATEAMNLLQLLSFTFNVNSGFPWSEWVADKFVPILQASNLSMISSGTSSLTLTMFLASLCFVLATFGAVIYVGYAFATEGVKQLWLLTPLRLALDLLTTILYVPALDSLLQIFQCADTLSDNITCGGTVHIILGTVVAILVLIFVATSGMAVMVIIERSPASGDVGAKVHGRMHALSLGLRGLMSFTFVAIGSDNSLVLVVQIVISALILSFAYFYYMPFYSMILNKVSMAVYGTFFFSTLCLVLEMLAYSDTEDRYGAFMAFVVGAPLCWFTCDSLIGARLRKLKHTPISGVESPMVAELILRAKYPLPQTAWDKCRKEYLHLVEEQFPRSAFLAIHVSLLLRDCGKDTLRSERLMQKCKNLELQFDERFVVFKHQLDVETARSTGMEGGGAINFMAFDNHINQAQQTVMQAMEHIVSVLKHLKSGSHNQEELLRLAYKLRRTSDNANFHLEQLMRITNDSSVVFRLYSLYLEFVINDKFMASALMDQAISLEEEAERSQGGVMANLKNSIHGTMTISGEESSLGIIRSVSANLLKMLGYSNADDLVGKSINTIVPEPYRKMHDAFLAKHLNQTTEFLQRQIDIWSLHASGYAIATHLEVTSEIDQQSGEVVFHGQLYRKRVEKQDFFCVDRHSWNIHFASRGALTKVLQVPVPDKDGRIGNLRSFMDDDDFNDESFQHLLATDGEGLMRLHGINYNVESKVITKQVPPHLDKPAMDFSIVVLSIDMEMVLAPPSEACSQDLHSRYDEASVTKSSQRLRAPLSPIADGHEVDSGSDSGAEVIPDLQREDSLEGEAGSDDLVGHESDGSTAVAPGSPANDADLLDIDPDDVPTLDVLQVTGRGKAEEDIKNSSARVENGSQGSSEMDEDDTLNTKPALQRTKENQVIKLLSAEARSNSDRASKKNRVEPDSARSQKSIGAEGQQQFSRNLGASMKRVLLDSVLASPETENHSQDSASEMASTIGRKRSVYDRVQRGIARKGKQVRKYQRLTFLSALVCFVLTLTEWFIRQEAYEQGMEAITQVGNSMKRAFYLIDLAVAVSGLNIGYDNNMTMTEAQELITLIQTDSALLLETHVQVTESAVNDNNEELEQLNAEPTIPIFSSSSEGYENTSLWLAVHKVITEMDGVQEQIELDDEADSFNHACGTSCQYVLNNAPVSIFEASNKASGIYAEIAVEELAAVRTYQWMNVIFTSSAFLMYTLLVTIPTIREAYLSFDTSCTTLFQVPRGMIKRVFLESQERNTMVRERLREEFDYDFDDGEESREEGPVPLGAQSIAERSVAEEIEIVKRRNRDKLARQDSAASEDLMEVSGKSSKDPPNRVTFSGKREVRVIPARKRRERKSDKRKRKGRRKNALAFVRLVTLQSAPFLITLVYVVAVFLYENVSMSTRISLSRMVNAAGRRWVTSHNTMYFVQDGFLRMTSGEIDDESWSIWDNRTDEKWAYAEALLAKVEKSNNLLTYGNETLGIDAVQDKTSFPEQYSLLFDGACFDTCKAYPDLPMSDAARSGLMRAMEFLNDELAAGLALFELAPDMTPLERQAAMQAVAEGDQTPVEFLFLLQHTIHMISEALQKSMEYFKDHLVDIVATQVNTGRLMLVLNWGLLAIGSVFVFRRYVEVNRKMQDIQFLLVAFPSNVFDEIPKLGNTILLENEKRR